MVLNQREKTPAAPQLQGDSDVKDEHEPEASGGSGDDEALATALAAQLAPKLEAVLANAVAKKLMPKLEVLMKLRQDVVVTKLQEQRAQLDMVLHSLSELQLAGEAPRPKDEGYLASPREGTESVSTAFRSEDLSPRIEKLLRHTERLEQKIDSTLSSPRTNGELERTEEEEVAGAMSIKRMKSMEARLAQKQEESTAQMLSRMRTSRSRSGMVAAQDSPLARASVVLEDSLENEEQTSDRTVVVNVRRFRSLLELCKVYSNLVHISPLGAMAIVVLSEGMLGADLVFLVGTCLMCTVHYLKHGVITLATDTPLRLGEHVGDDGQKLLDSHSPGIENPLSCIQALTWRRRRHHYLAEGLLILVWIFCLSVWIFTIVEWNGSGMGWLSLEEANYVAALNIVATVQLVAGTLFSMLMRREMHFVLPVRTDGVPWRIEGDGVANAWSPLLGPPCLYFGSPTAYDDFRIWAGLASKPSNQKSVCQTAGRFYPEELGLYALQGRDHAARLALSLREAKLFDSKRQTFLRRFPEEGERGDARPSLLITGLSKNAEKRGELYDVDLRRDFPEALRLHLLLYDSRTNLAWGPKRTKEDPSHWVVLKRWRHQEASPSKTFSGVDEEPVWEPTQLFGSTATAYIAYGTFGGFRVLISFASHRGDVSVPVGDLKAEIRAMKKLGEHPNILTLYTTGISSESQPYMATESYEAVGCLLVHLANHYSLAGQEFPPSLAKRLFEGLISALDHMHDQGLLHRGLRSAGVIVTGTQEAKLSDLGFVNKVGTKGKLKGSHNAPEACRGAEQGPPVDCWGLGIILHEIFQGRSDIMDCSCFPPKQRPGTPSGLRNMELYLKVAMHNLLEFKPSQRWTLQQLENSQWFLSSSNDEDRLELPTSDFESRSVLRRYVGRAPAIPACLVVVDHQDDGLIGKTLLELNFEEVGVHVLLVVRKTGSFCTSRPSTCLEKGDRLCIGFPADGDTDALLTALLEKLSKHTPEKPPVTGFSRAGEDAPTQKFLPNGASEEQRAARGSMERLVIFHAEFDCFCFPNHTSRVGRVDVGTLTYMGVHVMGVVRAGEWIPDWFPAGTTEMKPGDLGLIFRAPRADGTSVATMTDEEVDCLMNEEELLKRLAIARGLSDSGVPRSL